MIKNYIRYRILMEFFDKPTHRFQLRELSRDVKIGLPSIINHVKALEKEEFLITDDSGPYRSYISNRDNPKYKLYKKLDIIRRLFESGFIEFIERELSFPSSVILFGSCVYGEDIEKSDLDIAVISKEKDLQLNKYEKIIMRKIQIHFFKNINDMKKSPGLFNNIVNGVVLSGFIKIL